MAIALALAAIAFQPDKRSDAVESGAATSIIAGIPGLDTGQPKKFETATFGLG